MANYHIIETYYSFHRSSHMQSIIINGRRIAVSIVRSNRKTIQLKITSSTHIEVRAPLLMPDNAIHALLIKKQDWITSHLAKASQSLMATPSALPHVLLFFGREIPLHLHIAPNITTFAADYSETAFTLTHPPSASTEEIKNAIISYYRMTARTYLEEKSAEWAKRIGVTYNRITIKEQKTVWATCTSLKNLNYNRHLIQIPPELIDYVVIHELCHLRHLNHSPAFWELVSKYDPQYKEHKRALNRISTHIITSI